MRYITFRLPGADKRFFEAIFLHLLQCLGQLTTHIFRAGFKIRAKFFFCFLVYKWCKPGSANGRMIIYSSSRLACYTVARMLCFAMRLDKFHIRTSCKLLQVFHAKTGCDTVEFGRLKCDLGTCSLDGPDEIRGYISRDIHIKSPVCVFLYFVQGKID